MLKLSLFLTILIGVVVVIFKDNLISIINNNEIIQVKEDNHNYKTKPDDLGGKKFIGENLEVYEVTREKLLPRTETIDQKNKYEIDKTNVKSFYLQLASYKSFKIAEEKVKEFKNSIDTNISKFKYSIIDVDLADKGIFYRLRVGPFKSENDVHEVCKVFKIDKKNCIILEESTDKA